MHDSSYESASTVSFLVPICSGDKESQTYNDQRKQMFQKRISSEAQLMNGLILEVSIAGDSTGASSIDVSNIIFETIVLETPQKRVHPGIEDGSLKSEILDKLEHLKPKEMFLNKKDPRWDKLKELL